MLLKPDANLRGQDASDIHSIVQLVGNSGAFPRCRRAFLVDENFSADGVNPFYGIDVQIFFFW